MTLEARFHIPRPGFTLDVDFTIPPRGVTALFGPSGSGKTTILRCLAGLERAALGRLYVNGQCWQEHADFLPAHRRPVGYVFQEASLFPHLNVRNNLHYGQRRIPAAARLVDFDHTVQLFGLGDLLAHYPDQLSGGQRQRAAMARALLTSPELLLMDEPMASLDDASKADILPYLEQLHTGLAIPVLYVSHHIGEVARLADHMVLLEQGRVLAQGGLQEMLTRADLPLAHSEQASSVVDAVVLKQDEHHHLTELTSKAGPLWVSRVDKPVGQPQRIHILARDVTIALSPPHDSSVNNCLAVTIIGISEDPNPGHALLQLDAGGERLLSRITRRSCERLGLVPGAQVYALIKGVSLR